MELRLSVLGWGLNRDKDSGLVGFADNGLETATGSFDINVAMEKAGFAPASKGGRVKTTASSSRVLSQMSSRRGLGGRESEGQGVWGVSHQECGAS
jgi:hypothetical protein